MPDVFICYAREDKSFASKLHQGLVNHNWTVWIDLEDILPSEEWERKININIKRSDNFIFIISLDSSLSSECRKELDCALANRKRVIPVAYRPFNAEELPPPIKPIQWISFSDATFESDLQDLINILSQSRSFPAVIGAGPGALKPSRAFVFLAAHLVLDLERTLIACHGLGWRPQWRFYVEFFAHLTFFTAATVFGFRRYRQSVFGVPLAVALADAGLIFLLPRLLLSTNQTSATAFPAWLLEAFVFLSVLAWSVRRIRYVFVAFWVGAILPCAIEALGPHICCCPLRYCSATPAPGDAVWPSCVGGFGLLWAVVIPLEALVFAFMFWGGLWLVWLRKLAPEAA